MLNGVSNCPEHVAEPGLTQRDRELACAGLRAESETDFLGQ